MDELEQKVKKLEKEIAQLKRDRKVLLVILLVILVGFMGRNLFAWLLIGRI